MVLHTVVSQQLLPDINGGLVPVYEVLHMTPAVRSLIRDSKTHQIAGVMASSSAEGMITKDQSILALYQAGRITRETALNCADNAEQLQRRMNL
jgi:twitching motility protein PilT